MQQFPLKSEQTKQDVHKSVLRKFGFLILLIFATIGLVFTAGYVAVRTGLTNEKGIIDRQNEAFIAGADASNPLFTNTEQASTSAWTNGPEWQTLKSAVVRDASTIYKVSAETDIDPRIIVTVLVPEQLRLFHSEREIFKKIFAPLKILGNQSQFSWGIMGMKQETAKVIESNLKDPNSPYYLGIKYEKLLDFKTNNTGQERFERLTDEKNHYYSYLYATLYIRQVINQWQKAGFNISNRPEIIGTLYNIGFNNSHPNSNPSSGGSAIEINNITYSFGALSGCFYYSSELKEQFPRK